MKVKYSKTLLLSYLMCLNLHAYDESLENFIKHTIDQRLEDNYTILKEENEKQKKEIKEFQERIDDLEDSLESVETTTLLDKIDFSLGFNTTVNNFDKTYADGHTHSSNNIYTTKFMLNMHAKITDNMKFAGRLSMYKYWADSTIHFYSKFDNMQGRVPSSSALFAERAFVDWRVLNNDSFLPTILTIGRQPSSDGPSHQFKANTARRSTYSALVFDGASDGIVATSSLKNIIALKDAKIRFAYGKGYQNDQTKLSATNAFIGSDAAIKDTDVYGFFFESSILNRPDTLFQVGFSSMHNLIANFIDTDEQNNKTVGNINFLGMMLEGTNINNSGLDLFAHFAYAQIEPNENIYQYQDTSFSLLGNGVDFSDKSATAFWTGGRYSFSNKSKIGLEYNQGSKYWVTAAQGSFDLLNKLSTRGKAYEAYYIYPINRYSFLRFGGTYVDYDYTNSGWYLGKPTKFDQLSDSFAKDNVSSVKNLYLQFNVNY